MTKDNVHFKTLTKSKKGAIFTQLPCTATEVAAQKKAWANRGSNGPTSTLKFGSSNVKCYSALKNFGKQYFLAGDFTKVKKPVAVGTPMELVLTDKPVINNTTKKPLANLFWAYAG